MENQTKELLDQNFNQNEVIQEELVSSKMK